MCARAFWAATNGTAPPTALSSIDYSYRHPIGATRSDQQFARPTPPAEKTRGQYFGGEFQFDPWDKARGWLTAFDAATGVRRWQYQSSKPMIASVLTTGGDVVLAGEITGDFLAFDAEDGKILYKHNVGGPIGGGVLSYASGGKQYIAVVSGFVGGYYNMMAPEIGGGNPTVTVFALKP